MYFTQYVLYTACIVQSMYYTQYVFYTVCIVHSMYCTQYVLYTVCIVHSMYCTEYVLYTVCIVHSMYCTQYVFYTLCSIHSIHHTQYASYTFTTILIVIASTSGINFRRSNEVPKLTQSLFFQVMEMHFKKSWSFENTDRWVFCLPEVPRSSNRHGVPSIICTQVERKRPKAINTKQAPKKHEKPLPAWMKRKATRR